MNVLVYLGYYEFTKISFELAIKFGKYINFTKI